MYLIVIQNFLMVYSGISHFSLVRYLTVYHSRWYHMAARENLGLFILSLTCEIYHRRSNMQLKSTRGHVISPIYNTIWCHVRQGHALRTPWFIHLFLGPVVPRQSHKLPSLKYANLSFSVNSLSLCHALRMEESVFAIRKFALNPFVHWWSKLFSTSLITRSALAILERFS